MLLKMMTSKKKKNQSSNRNISVEIFQLAKAVLSCWGKDRGLCYFWHHLGQQSARREDPTTGPCGTSTFPERESTLGGLRKDEEGLFSLFWFPEG